MKTINTADESWLYHYALECKQANTAWKLSSSPISQKAKVINSAGKVIGFFPLSYTWKELSRCDGRIQSYNWPILDDSFEDPEFIQTKTTCITCTCLQYDNIAYNMIMHAFIFAILLPIIWLEKK